MIDLEVLENSATEYLKVRKEIEKKLKLCYYLNSESKELYELSSIFIDNFDFKERRTNDFKKSSFQVKSNRILQNSVSTLFVDNVSVVFVSLLEPVGFIRKSSTNFS